MTQDRMRPVHGDGGDQEPRLDPAEEELYAGTKIDSQDEALASEEAVEEALTVGGTVLPEDTDVHDTAYLLGRWRVLPEQKADFIAAWHELAAQLRRLPNPSAGEDVLIQSVSDPDLFYSLTPWQNLADIEAMRQDAGAQAAIAALRAYCSEAESDVYRTVAEDAEQDEAGAA